MKKLFIAMLCTTAFATVHAQCKQEVVFTAKHTQFIDSTGDHNRDADEAVTLKIKNDTLTITPPDANDEITGPVSNYSCKWTSDKTGKTNFDAIGTGNDGDVKTLHITITGDGSKITTHITVDEMPGLTILLTEVDVEEKD